MAFMVLDGCAIFIFLISMNERVIANSCENDNCKAAIDLPLITKLNAPLKAELDISSLTSQLKELIGNEVKQAVSVAMKDLAENIVDKRAESVLENLQTFNNRTISNFLQELEVKMDTNLEITANQIHSLTSVDIKLEEKIAQMMEKQMEKISSIESEVNKNSEKVAITAFYQNTETVSSGSVLKFDDVNFSVGITNLLSFKNTGKFVCEQSGLYMISVSILSETNGANFYIYRNGNKISTTYIAEHHGKNLWHTGTVTIAMQLEISDSVWVQTHSNIRIHGVPYSQFTIIKVK